LAIGQRLQLGSAGIEAAHLRGRVELLGHGQLGVVGTRQRRGAAGAALVDEHQVAAVVQARQPRQHMRGHADRALAGAAGQQQHRIGLLVARQGRHHEVVDVHLHTVRPRRVQRARQAAAQQLVGNAVDAAGLERPGRVGRCGAEHQRCGQGGGMREGAPGGGRHVRAPGNGWPRVSGPPAAAHPPW